MGSPYRQPHGGYDLVPPAPMPDRTRSAIFESAVLDEWYWHWIERRPRTMDECLADALLWHAKRNMPGL